MQGTTTDRITRTLTVEAPAARAFEVFTAGFDTWWPRTHHTGEGELLEAVIEPHAGGRWYARTTVGEEEWGRVLVWDPPQRIVLDWQLNVSFSYDQDFHTEVEVRFVADGPGRTRVDFEHRGLDAYGEMKEQAVGALNGEGGWPGILTKFAATAAA